MNFQKIGFIGLGLIGGSIAKKIKANCPETQIYAHIISKRFRKRIKKESLKTAICFPFQIFLNVTASFYVRRYSEISIIWRS